MERISKANYYLDIAQTVAERGTCLRKHFGAIIVKNDTIISTGYNGSLADAKTAVISSSAFAKSSIFLVARDTSSAAPFMQRQMPSLPHHVSRCSIPPFTWCASIPQAVLSLKTPRAAACAKDLSSMQASLPSLSATPRKITALSTFAIG